MDIFDADLVVIGAVEGLSGIAAARFYLDVHPLAHVVLLEKDSHLGGVWSSKRAYEGFWTQWTIGTAEWSDMKMSPPPEEDTFYNFFKAKYTTRYLEKYVDEHVYDGKTLRDKIVFEFAVQTVKKEGDLWVIRGNQMAYRTPKLIVAAGITSSANLPQLQGMENAEIPIIHQGSFGQSPVLTSDRYKKVTVIGGGKSAADMAYACVRAGKSVSWVIRKSGSGPGFLLSPKGKGPYKSSFELGSCRAVATFSPSIFSPDTWWTRFLHGTNLGQKFVNALWAAIDQGTRADADYNGREDASEGFKNLNPYTPLFWQNGTGGLLNRRDFWETVAPNVKVYLDDMHHIDKNILHLASGDKVESDVLLCGTGWNTAFFEFLEPKERVRLGLPHSLEDDSQAMNDFWKTLEDKEDREILKRFPMLANPPEHFRKSSNATPYRLYNGIGPIQDDSIAFIGYLATANYFVGVECQAIWATAFLDKKLNLPSVEEQQVQIARQNVFCRRRYLSGGERGNFFPFECHFYEDSLLEEVGLSSHIKSWFQYYFSPVSARGMSGLKDEYIKKYHDGIMKN